MRALKIALLLLGVASAPAWAANLCPGGSVTGVVRVNDTTSTATSCTMLDTTFGFAQTGATTLQVSGTVPGNSLLTFNTTSAGRTTIQVAGVAVGVNSFLKFVGTPTALSTITISNVALAGVTQVTDGGCIGIDFRSITLLNSVSVSINNNIIGTSLAADGSNNSTMLVGGIVFSQLQMRNSSIAVQNNQFVVNNRNLQGGALVVGASEPSDSLYNFNSAISFQSNSVLRTQVVTRATAVSYGAFIRLTIGRDGEYDADSLTTVTYTGNTFDKIDTPTYLYIAGEARLVVENSNNKANNYGALFSRFYLNRNTLPVQYNFRSNEFTTVNDYNTFNGTFGVELTFSYSLLANGSSIAITANEIHSATYDRPPIRIGWTGDMQANASLSVDSNRFTTSTLSTSRLMSFVFDGTDVARTIEDACIKVCNNVWPPRLITLTTTTTVPATTTRAPTTTSGPSTTAPNTTTTTTVTSNATTSNSTATSTTATPTSTTTATTTTNPTSTTTATTTTIPTSTTTETTTTTPTSTTSTTLAGFARGFFFQEENVSTTTTTVPTTTANPLAGFIEPSNRYGCILGGSSACSALPPTTTLVPLVPNENVIIVSLRVTVSIATASTTAWKNQFITIIAAAIGVTASRITISSISSVTGRSFRVQVADTQVEFQITDAVAEGVTSDSVSTALVAAANDPSSPMATTLGVDSSSISTEYDTMEGTRKPSFAPAASAIAASVATAILCIAMLF